jgi:hypothetical protein
MEQEMNFKEMVDSVKLNKRQKSSVGFYAKPIIPRLTSDFRPPVYSSVDINT